MNPWQEQHVLITGVCGTVGHELLRQLIPYQPAEIIGIDNNESDLFFLNETYRTNPAVHFYLGDVRDRGKLIHKMNGIDIVLHTAALKHVILCEESPRDAVQTNILGVQNIIDAAIVNHVHRVVFTSSDKAVNPTNVMGTSKLMGERLFTAAHSLRRGERPIFSSTRFGNVLGSRGSVIPLFKRQIASKGPVTLTDTGMTRFIMTLEEAVRLVMESVFLARGGEVFVTKMPIVKIQDLAAVMIEELAPAYGLDPSDVPIEIIGVKSGEKMYEELINEEETRRTIELKNYYVVTPAFKSIYDSIDYHYPGFITGQVKHPYNSKAGQAMPKEELRKYLHLHNLLSSEMDSSR